MLRKIINQLRLLSQRIVMLSNNVEGSLNVRNQNMSVPYFNTEFSLNRLVDMNAGLDIDEASLISPVSIERNGNSLYEGVFTFHLSGSI
jgi:hypothetical protein